MDRTHHRSPACPANFLNRPKFRPAISAITARSKLCGQKGKASYHTQPDAPPAARDRTLRDADDDCTINLTCQLSPQKSFVQVSKQHFRFCRDSSGPASGRGGGMYRSSLKYRNQICLPSLGQGPGWGPVVHGYFPSRQAKVCLSRQVGRACFCN